MQSSQTGKTKLRIGLIGCGAIAESGHLPALLSHPRFEVTGLCDTRPERLTLLGTMAPHALKTDNYATLIDHGCQAFVLALQPEVSVDVAADLLKRGLHVLDEKPLAVSLADAARLGAAVHSSAAVYQIGFVFRYSGFVKDVAAGIRAAGFPSLVQVDVFDERLDENNLPHLARIMSILKHSSAVTHEGSHVIDYARSWNANPFDQISAAALTTDPRFQGANVWSLTLRHTDGSVLQINIGWLLPRLPVNTIRAVGPLGRFETTFNGPTGKLVTPGGESIVQVAPFAQDWLAQLDVFARSIDAGTCLGSGFNDGLHALRTTLACEETTTEAKRTTPIRTA